MKRRIGENFIFFFWQLKVKKILLNYLDIVEFFEVFTKLLGSFVIWLNSDNFFATFCESRSNDARARADVDYDVALFNIAMTDLK